MHCIFKDKKCINCGFIIPDSWGIKSCVNMCPIDPPLEVQLATADRDFETIAKNLEVCRLCEFWSITRCVKCDCPRSAPMAWANRVNMGKCPMGKWL
jgi:glyoxylate carboligase